MSNFLAMATVTATLSQLLQVAVGADVPGATVTTVRPDSSGTGTPTTGVNLYLYQVTPNAALRNADLPTRRPDGQLAQRPQAALDLHYLLTFYGNEVQLEPQRLLGVAVRTLHARSVLTRQMIRDTVVNPAFPFLANSNLAEEVELVKFMPIPLSLEELSKLWSVFFQTPYTLSVAYQGTVVLIESDEMPHMALPVRTRNLRVIPFRNSVIEQIMSQKGPGQPIVADQPILAGYTLVPVGRQLHGDSTKVRVGGLVVTPSEVGDTRISLPLESPPFPANSLRAGVQAVQVIHELNLGTPADPHRGFESNVAAFVLRPEITSISASSTQVTLQVNPTVGERQRLVLLLNERSNTDPAVYTFIDEPRPADTNTIQIPISGVGAGEYFVRVQVDGAESPLDLDPASPTFGPRVTIP